MTQEKLIKHNKKQNIISAVILIAGVLFSIMIFGSDKSRSQDSENVSADNIQSDQLAKNVKTITLKTGEENVARLEKTVYLNSDSSALAVAEYSGRVKKVDFNVGKKVKEGEILASFDQANDTNSAKIAYESAKTSYDLALNNLKETKKITQESLDLADDAVDLAKIQLEQAKDKDDNDDAIEIAEENLDIAKTQEDQAEFSAKAQINGAEIQLEQARSALEQSQIGYDKTFIKAPISGEIVSKDVNVEDYINAGTSIAEIVGDAKLQTKIYLNASEIERVKEGDLVEIYSKEDRFVGKIKSLSNIANNNNQRFEVGIELMNGLITNANQNFQAILNLRILDDGVFYVPLDAINIGQTKTQVFIKKGDSAKSVEIKIGEIIGNQVEVVKGLKSGDEVIIEGNRGLRDGEKIVVKVGI